MPKNDTVAHVCPFASFRFIFILILWTLLHAGCAMWPEPTRSAHVGGTGPLASCADFFASLDGHAATTDAVDSAYSRVKHHPYLRADRFIASFRDNVEEDHEFAAWVDHMQGLDQSARQFELANLSDTDIAAMGTVDDRDALYRRVVECGNLLKKADRLDAEKKSDGTWSFLWTMNTFPFERSWALPDHERVRFARSQKMACRSARKLFH